MRIEEMKSLWTGQPIGVKQKEELAGMLTERSHPILKGIRKQLLLEISAWLIVLCVYYSMFDGEKRPLAINMIFIICILQAIAFNFTGYLAAKNLVHGDNIITSIAVYLEKLKRFKWGSLCSRIIFMVGMLFFFFYGVDMAVFRTLSLVFIGIAFVFQLWLLQRQWSQRIKNLVALKSELMNANGER
ncbi:hypothetical protein [Olivibacter domesticus]|uniref:Uncharacterized protein n=1 Tax=Olivibacter domesticus TaxID=407022 RepID=A0A1H7KY15_OLID1|nr:hypothetical protein [Olivibacter domesticus]SEK90995.1 hypothetical protein SAMN05661044_01483 [Olivibacter domesticus]